MLPTFIVAGAAKTGTSALHAYLNVHPQVCMSVFKEPNYFCKTQPPMTGIPKNWNTPCRYAKGLDWYQNLFQSCGNTGIDGTAYAEETAHAIGEISPAYFINPDAPTLIKQTIPGVHLIFNLRDPAARLYSHYWQERKMGWDLPDFAELKKSRHPCFERYLDGSSYHIHLSRYLEVFPRQQISVLLFCDMVSNPQMYMQNLYQIVGVDATFVPPNLGQRYNEPGRPRSARLKFLMRKFAEYRWDVYSHKRLYAVFQRIGRAFIKLNSVTEPYPPMPVDLRAELIKELSTAIDFSENYLGHPLPAWRKA